MRILLTGGASGVGRAVAEHFLSLGHEVISIDISRGEERPRLIQYQASVTDEESLLSISESLDKEGLTLDALVSVAGIHTMSSFVECDTEELRRVVDVNLVGAMLFIRIFHKFLSKEGRVVIVSSEVASLSPMPFNGLYSVSKTALDCYANALGKEIGLLGQRVVTVRPGAVETPLAKGSLESTERLAESTLLYRGESRRFLSLTKQFMGRQTPPERVARLIYRASTVKRPRAVYSINRNFGLVLMGILPQSVSRFILKLLLK